MRLGEALDEHVLRTIGVLVLVDQQVAELRRVAGPDDGRGLEQLHRLEEQIVEVERVALRERLAVLLEDFGDLLATNRPVVAERLGALHAVLGVADARERHPRRQQLVVDLQGLEDLLDGADLVGRVVDHEVARKADRGRFAAQQPGADRVEGRNPHRSGLAVEERSDTLAHFLGGLVGEGDGEDLVEVGEPAADDVGDAIGDDTGLARAGAREDQQRAFGMEDGVALFRIEFVEEGHQEDRSSIATRSSAGVVGVPRGDTGTPFGDHHGSWAHHDAPLRCGSWAHHDAPVRCGSWAHHDAPLLYGDALGEVAGLVDVAAAADGDVVREQLQRDHGHDGCHERRARRQRDA